MWMRRRVLQALSFQYLLVTERSDPLARPSWVLPHCTLPVPCCGAPRGYVISNSKPRVREDHQDASWCQLHHRSESRMPAELMNQCLCRVGLLAKLPSVGKPANSPPGRLQPIPRQFNSPGLRRRNESPVFNCVHHRYHPSNTQ